MDAPRIQYAKTSDEVSIAWYAIGSGPPYVWPANPPSSSAIAWRIPEFRDILQGIARGATLVTYDPRGFGLSDRGTMDYSCEASVRDLEAVSEAASLERFILQTFSYMAIPALTYAARHPERVMALVLLNGVIRGADMSASWKRLVRLADEDWEDAKVSLARMNEAGYASTVTLEQTREVFDRAASKEAFVAFSEALDAWDASDVVSRVTTPALVAHYVAQSTHTPLEACRRLAASLPNGTFVSVEPAAGEMLFDTASRTVRGFLRGVVPPSERRAALASLSSGTAVVLFADIVNSTGLTERLGDAAFRDKARELDGSLRSIIREAEGTPVEGKLLGDGVLAVFTSARQAIEAALACGRAGDDAGLPLHLGLHAGDVIREEGNVYGGAVNVAARIAAASAPGELLVSQTVRDLARTSAGVSFEDRGERTLKGIEEPQRLFAVREPDDH